MQAKDFGMRPHVGAVITDENGHIADNPNAALGTIRAQRPPLLEERELQESLLLELFVKFFVQLRNRFRVTANNLLRPAIPRLASEALRAKR